MQESASRKEPKTGAVIVAAGMSSRMGDFKPLLELGGLSFVKRTITNFKQAGVSPIVLVCGYRAQELERHVAGEGVLCVRNSEYADTEMIDSAKIGLEYVAGRCDRTFFSPVDVPLVQTSTVQQMMMAAAMVVRPVHAGSCGHPVLMDGVVIDELLSFPEVSDLGSFLRRLCDRTCFLPVADAGVLLDADTPADYEELIRQHNRQLLRPQVEISLWNQDRILDSAMATLLRVIDYDGTVKEACQRMGISYRKAWNLLARAEENLGTALVERIAGGEYGGRSRLTKAGEDLLRRYELLEDRVMSYARGCFDDIFADVPEWGKDGNERNTNGGQ